MNELQKQLFTLQDSSYLEFHSKLIPTIEKNRIIGIRTPALRSFAKDFKGTKEAKAFLKELPHHYYEENNLHMMLISAEKDYETCVREINRFLPYINNWATCDLPAPGVFKKHKSELYGEVLKWISSNDTYTIRYGIGILLRLYLDADFSEKHLALVAKIRSEEYYVNMMIAWYFATALAKQWDAAIPYLEKKKLSDWVHKKTIQKKKIKKAAQAIADLVEQKYQIVITHSNGPQVGMIQTAMTEFARLDNDKNYTVAPMSLCSAMSEGYIGYDLQNAIRTELLDRGIFKPVSTIITQVRVDPFDKAFNHPTKVIGRVMTREEADAEEEKGNHVVPEGDGFRRIIASPKPVDIYEIDAIEALLDAGQIVIAAGGGGIPVMEQGTTLKGASAVIEKDYTAAKLADMVDASHLMILTSKEQMETADGQAIGKISVSDAISLIDENHFDAITTLPKVDASVSFVSSGEGRTAIITKLENAYQGIKERIGTIIK